MSNRKFSTILSLLVPIICSTAFSTNFHGVHPPKAESASSCPREAPWWAQFSFQLGLLRRQVFLSARPSGTAEEGGLVPLGIRFAVQSCWFEIPCLYCGSISVLPFASVGIPVPGKQMRQSTTPPLSLLILQYTQTLPYHPDKALSAGPAPSPPQRLLCGSPVSWSWRDAIQISWKH